MNAPRTGTRFAQLVAVGVLVGGCGLLATGPGPADIAVQAEALSEGVLVRWNVPQSPSREVIVYPIPLSGQAKPDPLRVPPPFPATLVKGLDAGSWSFRAEVVSGVDRYSATSTNVQLGAALEPVSFVTLDDLGREDPFGCSVLVSLPEWGPSDDALRDEAREELELIAHSVVQVGFGQAYPTTTRQIHAFETMRSAFLAEFPDGELVHSLDARALLAVDLRLPDDDVAAQLWVRLIDLTFTDYPWEDDPFWNQRALLFESFVELPDYDYAPLVDNSVVLVRGFRQVFDEMAQDPLAKRYLALQASARRPFGNRRIQDKVYALLGRDLDLLRRLVPSEAETNHRFVESALLFPRPAVATRTEAPPTPVEQPAETEPADDVPPPAADESTARSRPSHRIPPVGAGGMR